ncbi:MAG: hypothetical protein F7B59_06745 [Desulfurococcales archaeon]|nr:hypothetical protein [Desulfurococcales archaeon]
MNIEELKRYLHDYVYSKSPGIYLIIDRISKTRLGVSLIDALFCMPDKLYELISSIYNDPITTNFIFKNLFLKPIILKLEVNIPVEDLYQAAKEGREKLLDLLERGGIKLSEQAVGCEERAASYS